MTADDRFAQDRAIAERTRDVLRRLEAGRPERNRADSPIQIWTSADDVHIDIRTQDGSPVASIRIQPPAYPGSAARRTTINFWSGKADTPEEQTRLRRYHKTAWRWLEMGTDIWTLARYAARTTAETPEQTNPDQPTGA